MTTKLYLIISSKYDRDKIKDLFANHPSVSYWFFNMKDTLFIKSTLTPKQIGELIEDKFGIVERYFVTEVTNKYWGRLPKEHWEKFTESPE